MNVLHPSRRRAMAAAFGFACMALLAGCDRTEDGPGGGPGGAGAPAPPKVGVVTVEAVTVPIVTELPGRVEPTRIAQVRARVTGIVQRRLFDEGSDVKAGQVLFRIDPAPYEAALASARAQLAKAQANLTQARELAERYRPLREAKAISAQEYVNAVAARQQAEADVAAARAAVQTAQLNLGYASVTAPISGRIGRALVSEGALVSQAEATQMATIQQVDPVYVNITQPVSELRRLREAVSQGQASRVDSAPVRVLTDDGQELAQGGRLLFSDLTVDPTTGDVSLRAEVPNPQTELLPGMYVRVRLAQAQFEDAVLLPQQAVMRNAQGDFVYVVGPDGKPAQRQVRVDGAQGSQWIVLSGVKPGEQVIVEGFQRMQPGAPVTPVPWAAPGASAPGGAGGTGPAGTGGPGSDAPRGAQGTPAASPPAASRNPRASGETPGAARPASAPRSSAASPDRAAAASPDRTAAASPHRISAASPDRIAAASPGRIAAASSGHIAAAAAAAPPAAAGPAPR